MAWDQEADLLEREEALGEMGAALDSARAGRGTVLVVEAAAGIGKTSLLDAVDRRASEAGFRALRARSGQLEEGFAFGVVRQLFERLVSSAGADEQRRWLLGAAASARPLFDSSAAPAASDGDNAYGLLRGLCWLVTNVADDGPLCLLIDDAHWADEASLRFVSFLAPRLGPLSVLVVLGTRPGRRELDALALDPAVRVVRPAPLSLTGVTHRVASVLGQAPAAAFAASCAEVTGGNPFLLKALIREIRAERMVPDAAHAQGIRALTPKGVATTVLLRLAGLPAPTKDLVRAVAVLEAADADLAAVLAGLEIEATREAATALVAAGVLVWDQTLTFVHPIMRTAVYAEIPAAERTVSHGRAALLLSERGAPLDLVAAHLLLASDRVPGAVRLLREAAERASALGSPTTAARYLQHGLRDAVPGPEQVDLLIELGRAEAGAGLVTSRTHLSQALEAAPDVRRAAAAATTLARTLRYAGDGLGALDVLDRLVASWGPLDADLAESVDVELLACASMSGPARLRLADWLAARRVEPPHPPRTHWDHLRLATMALDASLAGEPVSRVEDLAARAVAGSTLLEDPAVASQVRSQAGLAYLCVDRFDQAAALFDGLITESADAGLAAIHAHGLATRATLHLRCGRLAEAYSDATRAVELAEEVDTARSLRPRAGAILVSVAAERGERPPSRWLTGETHPDSLSSRLLVHARAELLLAEGHVNQALVELLAYGESNLRYGWGGVATPWRSQAALAIHQMGDGPPARAQALVADELDRARAQGAPRSLGIALQASGLLADGARRAALLDQAVEVLADSGATLCYAWALAHLGVEHRRSGAPERAREHLRRAHDLAQRCDATRLAALTSTELRLAGGRPRRSRVSGPDSLTPSEAQVVGLVADGLTNRQAAQALFVTEKTVETHLAHAYAKLGVRVRRDLPKALGIRQQES